MRFTVVKSPLRQRPHQCIITGRSDGELIDTHTHFTGVDPHVYLKKSIVEELAAKACGMTSAADAEALNERIGELEGQLAEVDLTQVPDDVLIEEIRTRFANSTKEVNDGPAGTD